MPETSPRRSGAPSTTDLPAHTEEACSMFQPVRVRRTFEAVCDQIRQQLARGQLRPGDRLPGDRELAEQFGISRSGVRDALRSLESAGLVEVRTGVNGGFFIHSGDSTGLTRTVQDMVSLGRVPIVDLTEARVELMGVAIRLACARAKDAELDAIEADIDHHTALFEQGRGSRNSRSVIEFYRLIARATHNEVIVMMVDALSEIIRTLLDRVDPQPRQDIIQVRRKVLALMRARDAEAAASAMAAHLRAISDYLESESRKPGRRRKLV